MIDLLTSAYNQLNQNLFESKLPLVEFRPTVSRKVIFRFSPQNCYMGIGSEFLSVSNADHILDELLHEMVHVYHWQMGIPDCTVNQYHNLVFANKALDVGLVVFWNKTRSWGVTSSSKVMPSDCGDRRLPDTEAQQRREATYRLIGLSLVMKEIKTFQKSLKRELQQKKQKRFQLKYICECNPPHNCIRSGRRPGGPNELNVTCNVCGAKFVLEVKQLA